MKVVTATLWQYLLAYRIHLLSTPWSRYLCIEYQTRSNMEFEIRQSKNIAKMT